MDGYITLNPAIFLAGNPVISLAKESEIKVKLGGFYEF